MKYNRYREKKVLYLNNAVCLGTCGISNGIWKCLRVIENKGRVLREQINTAVI